MNIADMVLTVAAILVCFSPRISQILSTEYLLMLQITADLNKASYVEQLIDPCGFPLYTIHITDY